MGGERRRIQQRHVERGDGSSRRRLDRSGLRSGTQTFFFKNLWSYATGTYTLTMTYTLSAA